MSRAHQQEQAAHFCATLITFGLERDTNRVKNFLADIEGDSFSTVRRDWKDVETISEGLQAIRLLHMPQYWKGDFDEPGANFTWHRAIRQLEEFTEQESGNEWKLQRPEISARFMRETRLMLAKKYN